ncbi:MAG: DUF2971 domain-containing protein [Bryobacteraceae bacterium]|nr:DUF2971 domain-containing protein [Bryobacteraceae bacterium]
MKLYRYRPASELVFKELRYSELYLASRDELNDPLDLNAQLNFFQRTNDETRVLARFLQGQAFIAHSVSRGIDDGGRMLKLMTVERLAPFLRRSRKSAQVDIMAKKDLFDVLRDFYRECNTDQGVVGLDAEELILFLDGLFGNFFNHSAVACFSERPDDFLMWSHYAGGHAGVCLEFEAEIDNEDEDLAHLPVLGYGSLGRDCIPYKQDIRRVRYGAELTRLDFVDFLPVFQNAGDIDLINLSKSYWHPYAHKLKGLFLEKLDPWSYEKEWRIVDVNFQSTLSEDRICNYSPVALTGVYFGARVSETTRQRVNRILSQYPNQPRRYHCHVDGTRKLDTHETED